MDNELTVTYRGRAFAVLAISDDHDAWTESVTEHLRDGKMAHWDGSGVIIDNVHACLILTVRRILSTVDESAATWWHR